MSRQSNLIIKELSSTFYFRNYLLLVTLYWQELTPLHYLKIIFENNNNFI
jgi:hypothetical protein